MSLRRRTLLQSAAALVALTPLSRLRLFAQATGFSDANLATLRAVAEVVLPAAIGRAGRDAAVARFAGWVRNYKEGADRGHAYGSGTIAAVTGPSPFARYAAQFAALDEAARAETASSFSVLALDKRRAIVERTLNTPQPVQRLPARPTGANLIADFMGLYFNSAEGFDLAYDAAIERDTCRGLDGSDRAPAPRRPGL